MMIHYPSQHLEMKVHLNNCITNQRYLHKNSGTFVVGVEAIPSLIPSTAKAKINKELVFFCCSYLYLAHDNGQGKYNNTNII